MTRLAFERAMRKRGWKIATSKETGPHSGVVTWVKGEWEVEVTMHTNLVASKSYADMLQDIDLLAQSMQRENN